MALSASLYGGTPFLGTAMGIQVLETHRQESTPYYGGRVAFGSQWGCMGSLSKVHACFMSCFQQASRDCRLLCTAVWRTVLAQPHPLLSTPLALQETVMSIGWVIGPVVGRFGSQICMHSRQSTQPAATVHVNTLKPCLHSAGERAVHRLGDWAGGGWVWGPDRGLWDTVLHHCNACVHLLPAAVLAHTKGYAQALHAEGCANSREHVPAPGAQIVMSTYASVSNRFSHARLFNVIFQAGAWGAALAA
jgi:hypothetical protein